jgi:hypothetical protein
MITLLAGSNGGDAKGGRDASFHVGQMENVAMGFQMTISISNLDEV